MRIVVVPCELKLKPRIEGLERLHNLRVGIFSTPQHRAQVKAVKEQLEAIGARAEDLGLLKGCDFEKVARLQHNFDAFLCVATGRFHGICAKLVIEEKPVYVLNPLTGALDEIPKEAVEKLKGRRRAGVAKLHAARVVGILVSVKRGQLRLGEALKLKKSLEQRGKVALIFVGDELLEERLLNFRDVEVWVNTACPRLVEDFEEIHVVNLRDLEL